MNNIHSTPKLGPHVYLFDKEQLPLGQPIKVYIKFEGLTKTEKESLICPLHDFRTYLHDWKTECGIAPFRPWMSGNDLDGRNPRASSTPQSHIPSQHNPHPHQKRSEIEVSKKKVHFIPRSSAEHPDKLSILGKRHHVDNNRDPRRRSNSN